MLVGVAFVVAVAVEVGVGPWFATVTVIEAEATTAPLESFPSALMV